ISRLSRRAACRHGRRSERRLGDVVTDQRTWERRGDDPAGIHLDAGFRVVALRRAVGAPSGAEVRDRRQSGRTLETSTRARALSGRPRHVSVVFDQPRLHLRVPSRRARHRLGGNVGHDAWLGGRLRRAVTGHETGRAVARRLRPDQERDSYRDRRVAGLARPGVDHGVDDRDHQRLQSAGHHGRAVRRRGRDQRDLSLRDRVAQRRSDDRLSAGGVDRQSVGIPAVQLASGDNLHGRRGCDVYRADARRLVHDRPIHRRPFGLAVDSRDDSRRADLRHPVRHVHSISQGTAHLPGQSRPHGDPAQALGPVGAAGRADQLCCGRGPGRHRPAGHVGAAGPGAGLQRAHADVTGHRRLCAHTRECGKRTRSRPSGICAGQTTGEKDVRMILIVGAGLAGLSTAYHLKDLPYRVFEKEKEAGGLCRSYHKDGFTFDMTGHLLHFRQPAIKALVERLLDGRLEQHRRRSYIYSHQAYTEYPFQVNTYGLPPEVIRECLLGFIATLTNPAPPGPPEERSFKAWILDNLGEGMAKHFMVPFNEKLWQVPMDELTSDWVSWLVPKPELKDVINGALGIKDKAFGYNPTFLYPSTGGINALPQSFLPAVRGIAYDTELVEIETTRRRAVFRDGRQGPGLKSTKPWSRQFRFR